MLGMLSLTLSSDYHKSFQKSHLQKNTAASESNKKIDGIENIKRKISFESYFQI